MNRRNRNRSTTVNSYLRYLKPGALAQIRDRKIHSKTHYKSSDYLISVPRALTPSVSVSPSRSANGVGSGQQQESAGTNGVIDGEPPCFSPRFYGPRCPQRKKLMAVRAIVYSEPSDGSGSAIDAFANDFLVSH